MGFKLLILSPSEQGETEYVDTWPEKLKDKIPDVIVHLSKSVGEAMKSRFWRNRTGGPAGPDPHRYGTLDRERIDPRVGYPVPTTLEVHHFLGPQHSQHLDLLLATPAPVVKILPQRLVLDRIPSDTNTQAQAASA